VILSSGNAIEIERRFTYGEIAIVVTGLMVFGLMSLRFMYEIVMRWMR